VINGLTTRLIEKKNQVEKKDGGKKILITVEQKI
jgi:hypothetical protein